MPLFLIERNFAEQLQMDRKVAAHIQEVNADLGCNWLFSFLSADKKKTYCLYEAPNAEVIRENARRLNIPADVVIQVSNLKPEMFTWTGNRPALSFLPPQVLDVVRFASGQCALRTAPYIMGWVSGDRVLGLLAQTTGQLDKAAEHFEDALAFWRKAGYRPELAWTCCDYADCLLVRARQAAPLLATGDRQKAMALLDEALRISNELCMRPLMEGVLSRREILQAWNTAPTNITAVLSACVITTMPR